MVSDGNLIIFKDTDSLLYWISPGLDIPDVSILLSHRKLRRIKYRLNPSFG